MTQALQYDDLPAGSELRREYDGAGGVTITAPAGELPAPVRSAIARAALIPASAALAACVGLAGFGLQLIVRDNRLDPELRLPAIVALAIVAGGVFLLVWFTQSSRNAEAAANARQQSTALHATRARLLIESSGPWGNRSAELPVGEIAYVQVVRERLDPTLRTGPIPCVQVQLRNGTRHLLLGGHHPAELRWAAAALSQATGVDLLSEHFRR